MMNLTPEQLVLLASTLSAVIGAITAAIVGVTKANAEAAKMRAEAEAIRRDLAKGHEVAKESAQLLRETHHQVIPNGGSSLMDSSTRAEAALSEVRAGLARSEGRLRDVAAEVRGLRRDVGRLADTDLRDREAADHAHKLIHQRIDELNC